MAQKTPDYYKVLKVPSSVSAGEIKTAYRRLVRECGHDVGWATLPPTERDAREWRMRELNEAYETLSSPEKRKVYDQSRVVDSLFGEDNIFGPGGIFDWRRDWGPFQREEASYFLFPENDLGLLAALVQAYQLRGDGRWKVLRAESDQRSWMPESLYVVERIGEKVLVFRRVVDWRWEGSRDQPIQIADEKQPWRVGQEIPPDRYLGEYYLGRRGRRLLRGFTPPSGFDDYLVALKSLARKIAYKEANADGSYDVAQEVMFINNYARLSGYLRDEDTPFWQDHEVRQRVDFAEFWTRLTLAEGKVIKLESRTTPEGQSPSGEIKG